MQTCPSRPIATCTMLLVLLLCSAIARAQKPARGVTLPAAFATQSALGNNNIPLSWGANRYQQIFDGAELPAMHVVRALGFRFEEAFPWTFEGKEVDLEIRLGYSTRTPATLTTSFAGNYDVSTPPPVMVRKRGFYRLPDQLRGRQTSPTKFEVQIPFDTPFLWQRSTGRNLLLEIVVHGTRGPGPSRFTYPLDAEMFRIANTTRLRGSLPNSTTGVVNRSQGLVVCMLDKIEERGTFYVFGDACRGTGGHTGRIVPAVAARVMSGSQISIGGGSFRAQQLIGGNEIGATQRFIGHGYRTSISHFDIDARPVMLEVKVGSTRASPAGMSTSFAANASRPLTTVLPRTRIVYPLIEARNTDPKNFSNRIPWARPFVWPATSGESFLIELRVDDVSQGSYPADAMTNWNSSWLWARGSTSTNGTVLQRFGHALCLLTGSTGSAIPVIRRTGRPVLGRNFTLRVLDARVRAPALLALGASKSRWGAFTLPLALRGGGGGNCTLLVSPDVMLPAPIDGFGRGSVTLPIPLQSSLSGVEWHNQWLILDPAANALGIALSAAGTTHVGSQ